MLTRLYRRVLRETAATYRRRPIVILLEEGGHLIRLREKGRRTWHTLTVEQAFWRAVENTRAEIGRARLARLRGGGRE